MDELKGNSGWLSMLNHQWYLLSSVICGPSFDNHNPLLLELQLLYNLQGTLLPVPS